jgi:hypothetical protein
MLTRTWAAAALAALGLFTWASGARAGDDVVRLNGGKDAPTVTLDGKGDAALVPTAIRVGVGPRGVRVGVGRPGYFRRGVVFGPRVGFGRRGWWGPRRGYWGPWAGWWGPRRAYWGPWGGWWGRPGIVIRTGPAYVPYGYPVVVPSGPVVTNTYGAPAAIQPGVTPTPPIVGASQDQESAPPTAGTYEYDGGPAQPVPMPKTVPGPTSGTSPNSTAPLRDA